MDEIPHSAFRILHLKVSGIRRADGAAAIRLPMIVRMSNQVSGAEIAYRADGRAPDADLAHLAAVEHLLARYNIRLAVRTSAHTGRPVLHLVDARTGEARQRVPRAVSRRLATLAARAAAGLATARRSA